MLSDQAESTFIYSLSNGLNVLSVAHNISSVVPGSISEGQKLHDTIYSDQVATPKLSSQPGRLIS
jgi:hypothetical protein